MKQPELTEKHAFNRGRAARVRYGFSLTTQEPDKRVVAAGLEDAWWRGYEAECKAQMGVSHA